MKHSDETKLKISESMKGRVPWNKGITHSDETKLKIGIASKGRKHSDGTKLKISESMKGLMAGRKHPNYKGRKYSLNNIPLYDTYAHQISYAEKVRRNKDDLNILEVKCAYCGKWFISKNRTVINRIQSLEGIQSGEQRLYCSNNCKQECPTYRKIKFSAEENNTKQYSREVQPELRQLVFERDEWTCQRCESIESLHCHHFEGIEINPIESADIDNCITLCKTCHKETHKKPCPLKDYKRKSCH